MATYPLKNISIGGDTYEIQAGTDLFDFYVRVDCDYREITTSNIVSIGVSKNWQQIPTADIWSTMSGDAVNSAQVQLSIAPNEFAPSGAEGCNLWVLNRYPYSSGSVSSQDFIFISEPYTKNGSIYMTKVVITVNENNQLSGVGESIALGGGGGGGSTLHTLSIYKDGAEIGLANLAQSDTVELWDISTSTTSTLDATGLANIIKASPVVIKDGAFYAYLSSFNTAYKELSLIYANSTQMYALTLSHTWGTNWQVSGNKRLATQ